MDLESLTRPLVTWWQLATDTFQRRHPSGTKRSGSWPRVRDEYLKGHPECACCGGTKKLRVHHRLPFHLRPDLELDPENLMTLCEAGKFGINCHFLLGHLGNWKRFNPLVRTDVIRWHLKLTGRAVAVATEFGHWLVDRDWEEFKPQGRDDEKETTE
ncbi:MAG: hypothetical protein ABJZ55_02085 [Fuerstiella sp.]